MRANLSSSFSAAAAPPARGCGAPGVKIARPWAALALLLALAAAAGPAAAALPEGGAVDLARSAWEPALLGKSWPARFQALDEMRVQPELARQALLLAVSDPAPVDGRWRLIRHLAEFGQTEDIPVLLDLAAQTQDPMERRFAIGSARALYPRYEPPADLTRAVADFIFLQTRPAQPYDEAHAGAWTLTPRAEEEYLRTEMPIATVVALRALRGKAYRDEESLAAAMQKKLSPIDWKNWQETLLASLAPLPPRVQMEGILRVRVSNPLERPLLVQIGFGVWRARFDSDPGQGLLFVKPGEEVRYEVPVRLIAPVQLYPARIDQIGRAHV